MKIGVDGGGTKTELVLLDEKGMVLRRHLADGCNPSVVGPDRARALLLEALGALAQETSPITHTLLCMAGSQDFWRTTASSLSGYGSVEATTDATPVLELATGGSPGMVIHAGTGSFVALRSPDMGIHFVGGFGWRIGDAGSAQDVGRRALVRGVSEMQGWMPVSGLSRVVSEELGSGDPSVVTGALHRHAEPNRIIGAIASRISNLAVNGDGVARTLLLDAATDLVKQAEQAAKTFLCLQSLNTLPAGLSGPILTQSFLLGPLQERTQLQLKPLSEPPIEGVRRLLNRMR